MCRQAELLGFVLIVGILSGVALPLLSRGIRSAQVRTCAQNLRILHRTGSAYAATQQAWPDSTGEDLWKTFTRTTPPLLKDDALEVLVCPVLGSDALPGETDYRGPRVPWNKLALTDPLAADKPGNHGEESGGCVLYKDGRVEELDDAAWKALASRLSP